MVKKVRKFTHTPAVRALLVLIGGVVAVGAGIALSPLMDFSPPVIARVAGCEDPSCKLLPTECEKPIGPKYNDDCGQDPKKPLKKTGLIGKICVEKDGAVGGGKGTCTANCRCGAKTTTDGKPLMKPMMMPMKDMMGGMPPMLPMPPMKMPGMMMPMMDMMMPMGGCDSLYARYFPSPECQQGQTDQSPVSSFLQQSWDRLGNLFGNDTETVTNTETTLPTTVDPDDTGGVAPKETTTNTNNTNTNAKAPIVPATTFPTNTSPPLETNPVPQQQAWQILENLKKTLQDLLKNLF